MHKAQMIKFTQLQISLMSLVIVCIFFNYYLFSYLNVRRWLSGLVISGDCNWEICEGRKDCLATCLDKKLSPYDIVQNLTQENGLPDVRMLRKMFLLGVDPTGVRWPLTSKPFCKAIQALNGNDTSETELIEAIPIRAVDDSNINTSVLCSIYTVEGAHTTRVRAIRNTWGGMCDGFLAFSTKTDYTIPSISIPHKGREMYSNMWQKVRSIWNFIGTHYVNEFDYFLLGGDDMLVIPQNLRLYLSTLAGSADDHHFLGRRLKKPNTSSYFYSGGSGYVLSRGMLKTFLKLGYAKCHRNRRTAEEDVLLSDCLRKITNMELKDTSDEIGRERFHPLSPKMHLSLSLEEPRDYAWLIDYTSEWGLKTELNCCSTESVTFHYISSPQLMYTLNCLIHS